MSNPIQYQPRWAPKPPTHPLAAGNSLLCDIFGCLAASSIDESTIATQIIGCVTMVTQGMADVAWPNGQVCPIGQSVLLVAPSSSGKSAIYRILFDVIERFLHERVRQLAGGQSRPEFMSEDSTREALIEHLKKWPVVALRSDEAGLLERLMRAAAPTIAKLIDGSPLRHARVSTGRVELVGHRFTMNLLEQPDLFQSTKTLLGASNGSVGVVNRITVGVAEKLPTGASVFDLKLLPNVQALYQERISTLLDAVIKLVHDRTLRPTLVLTQAAKRHLIETGTQIRVAAQQDARFVEASEYVTRHAERVIRLAGALHVFQHGAVGEVDIVDVETARQVDLLSIEAFLALTQERPKPTQVELDAALIDRGLADMAYRGQCYFPLAYLRRISPNLGMTKARFDRALPLLAGSGRATIFVRDRQDWLQVNGLQSQQIQSSWRR